MQNAEFDDYGDVTCEGPNHSLWWILAVAFIFVVTTVSCICFVAGWVLSKKWHEPAVVVQPLRPRVRVRRVERRDETTQCNRLSTDAREIERLTINSIRDDLLCYGETTYGTKVELAERLRQRRALDIER